VSWPLGVDVEPRMKVGHHSEVGAEAGFLETECRAACLIGVLHGAGGAAGDDTRVEGTEGMNPAYEAGGEVEGP
jgi:hypothetical protein